MLLFLAACIWGFAFAFQSQGMDYMGPHTFNAVRFFIGGSVLIPVIFIFRKPGKKEKALKKDIKTVLYGGVICGICLFVASTLQQFGIQHSSVGKTGFLTTLYIIFVPIILGIFCRKKISIVVWFGAVLSMVGVYLLCVSESMSLNIGDICSLGSAFMFALQIMAVDYYAPRMDGVVLSCLQFFVSGILCLICAFIFEEPSLNQLAGGIIPLLYVGVMSSGVGYTLQILGQKHADPTLAALIMSLESAISVLGGYVILGEKLSFNELLGCMIMFIAVVGVQVFDAKKNQINLD